MSSELIPGIPTLSFVFNSPYTIGDKLMGLMAQFGFRKEAEEREAAKPEEHRSNGNGSSEDPGEKTATQEA